jgi:cytochrome P450
MTTTSLSADDIDLSSEDFWGLPWAQRYEGFAALRRDRPYAFFAEPEVPLPDYVPGPGYYALTRYADVLEVSKRPADFRSSPSAVSIMDIPVEFSEFFGSMINMDDPRHARLRKIVSGAFTPRMLQRILDDVERIADEVIDGIIGKGEIDLVTDLAAPFPLMIICDMMGIPRSQMATVLHSSNMILSGGDPELMPPDVDPQTELVNAALALSMLMTEIAADRRVNPTDDLTSALVNAEVDGETLTDAEIGSFFILLVVAGNETTRNAISHGVNALHLYPEQKRIWLADVDGVSRTAVEEIVRFGTPVTYMRRTVARDVELNGQPFKEGDKVCLFYNSANRDESVFENGEAFDVRRDPNPHVGFGGPGPHFCLGAHLARREISVMFHELFRRIPDLEVAGEADQLLSNFINGIKHLPVKFTPGT